MLGLPGVTGWLNLTINRVFHEVHIHGALHWPCICALAFLQTLRLGPGVLDFGMIRSDSHSVPAILFSACPRCQIRSGFLMPHQGIIYPSETTNPGKVSSPRYFRGPSNNAEFVFGFFYNYALTSFSISICYLIYNILIYIDARLNKISTCVV